MTTHRRRRCAHCQALYSHQSSGPGSDGLNNEIWCPDCMAVVNAALKSVPVAVERFSEVVTGADRDAAILALHDLEVERAKKHAAGELVIRRVYAPLFYMDEGKITATKPHESVTIEGVSYMIGTWSDNREPQEVRREMERDLRTGETRPWVDVWD